LLPVDVVDGQHRFGPGDPLHVLSLRLRHQGNEFRVTVEMDQNSSYETDVYVVDIKSVKGARP
jgi:hypothetical protein